MNNKSEINSTLELIKGEALTLPPSSGEKITTLAERVQSLLRDPPQSNRLEWSFDDQGEWCAKSSMKDSDGDASFQYRIQVLFDGKFSVNASDPQLGLLDEGCAETLIKAMSLCDRRESEITKLAEAA